MLSITLAHIQVIKQISASLSYKQISHFLFSSFCQHQTRFPGPWTIIISSSFQTLYNDPETCSWSQMMTIVFHKLVKRSLWYFSSIILLDVHLVWFYKAIISFTLGRKSYTLSFQLTCWKYEWCHTIKKSLLEKNRFIAID